MISFENQEYDINSLFNFQYNFDQLKFLITALIRNQKQNSQKFVEFDEIISDKEKRIEEIGSVENTIEN